MAYPFAELPNVIGGALGLGDAYFRCLIKAIQAAINQTMDSAGAIRVVIDCAGFGTPNNVLGREGPASTDHFSLVA